MSGGSLASAYYVVEKPAREVPVLTPDGRLTEAYQAFFARFKETMGRDFENPLFWKNMFRLRWVNPAWTAVSLKDVLEDTYLGDIRLGDLASRQARGDSPYIMINTTLYNDGRRLVWSTLEPDSLWFWMSCCITVLLLFKPH